MLGYTSLQASTDFACVGENVTFSCATSYSLLIWEVKFADRAISSMRHLFHRSDTPGRPFPEPAHGMYFQMILNKNGILDSILVVYTSAALENAIIECEGLETQRLTFRLACKYALHKYSDCFIIYY